MKKCVILSFIALILLSLSSAVLSEQQFEEDLHYFSIIPEQPGGEGDRVQITEFFLYTCPHCYQLEPHLEAWLKRKPDNVDFDRVPAMFNRESMMVQGNTYYALRLMGVADQLHEKIFAAIHENGEVLDTQKQMEEFLAQNGVDLDAYRKAMKSFAVKTRQQGKQTGGALRCPRGPFDHSGRQMAGHRPRRGRNDEVDGLSYRKGEG